MKNVKKEGSKIVGNYNSNRIQNFIELKQILTQNIDALGDRWGIHLPLFLGSSELARILWFNELYKKIIDIPGSILEFGSQYGASFNLLNMLKLVYEPWNASREVLSFSTFDEGFVDVNQKDGEMVSSGDYSTSENWLPTLTSVLDINASVSPLGKFYSIYPGDCSVTFPQYLKDNPHSIFSLVHFDLDVYAPTKNALELALERMPKGAIIVFDELNHPGFPGETLAVHEVMGIHNLKLRKTGFQPYSCYVEIGA